MAESMQSIPRGILLGDYQLDTKNDQKDLPACYRLDDRKLTFEKKVARHFVSCGGSRSSTFVFPRRFKRFIVAYETIRSRGARSTSAPNQSKKSPGFP